MACGRTGGASWAQLRARRDRDTDLQVGFDIASRLVKGVTKENRGFASLVVNGQYGFYGINLLTGQASFLGKLSDTVIDIAVSLK